MLLQGIRVNQGNRILQNTCYCKDRTNQGFVNQGLAVVDQTAVVQLVYIFEVHTYLLLVLLVAFKSTK